jgi:thermitase
MLRRFHRLAAWLVWLGLAVFCAPVCGAEAGGHIIFEDNRLTLRVTQTPLSKILGEISRRGVRISRDPTIDPPISADFSERPIDIALAAIIKDYSYSLTWRAGAGGRQSLERIEIFRGASRRSPGRVAAPVNLAVQQTEDGGYIVKNYVLVQLLPGVEIERISTVLSAYGAAISGGFAPAGIIRVILPADMSTARRAELIAALEDIAPVAPDTAYPLKSEHGNLLIEPAATNAFQAFTGSQPAVIAVLDSGLHAAMDDAPYIAGVYDAVADSSTIHDGIGHGTHMSLLAAGAVRPLGVADDSTDTTSVLAIRAFDDNGFTSDFTLMRGLHYALANNARVVSMSWGTETPSPLLEQAMEFADQNGLLLIGAAGNEPSGNKVYPAAYNTVIGVGALDELGGRWESSNHGDFVSLYAPGMAEFSEQYSGVSQRFAGTSIATAHVAGRAARIIAADPDIDKDELLQLLMAEEK